MVKKRADAKLRLLGILGIVIGLALGAVLTEPLANFLQSTGIPMWTLLISILGLAALFFGGDAYTAHRRRERFLLRVSNPGQRGRAYKPGKPTQQILESRARPK